MMKCFISFFGHTFTVPEASINKLAADSAPPIVGTTEHMDHMLDCWHKDLVGRLTVKIGSQHSNQPAGFSCASVDFVIGADHGQGSFRAGVKVICRKADSSVAVTAIYGLGEIECAKDTGDLLALTGSNSFISQAQRTTEERRVSGTETGNADCTPNGSS
jgi:hypothetical protein